MFDRSRKNSVCSSFSTLILGVFLVQETATGASSRVPAIGPMEAQSKVPTRARDYVDDYAKLNAMREGVVSLPSGVQYEVLRSGNGKQPCALDTVVVHYKSMLPTGVQFDNTYERGEPERLPLDRYVVPGLKEALLLMKEGDEWRVTIPAERGFRGGRFLRKRDLIYEVELIAIIKPANEQKSPASEQQP